MRKARLQKGVLALCSWQGLFSPVPKVKAGNHHLRWLLVQAANYILGPLAADSGLRRWGLQLAARGGKNGKRRAVVATARKLAVLLHRLWVTGEVYEPLYGMESHAA